MLDNCALSGSGGDGDPAASAELEQAFVAERTESTKHGVGVGAQDGSKISGWWQPFTGLGFAVRDGTTDRCRGLFVQRHLAAVIELAIHNHTSYSSTIVVGVREKGPQC